MALQDGNIIIGTSVDMHGMNTGLKKISKSMNNLSKKVSSIFGLTGLGLTAAFVALGRSALDAASDLQEVQNVVDVSFTKMDESGNIVSDMTWKVEQFANTCIEKFGMSRLAAKQTAGSFMAMGKSMDLTMEEASDMAVKLTGLTGDFSSFYNISQEYARVALSAVYTGETETLKRYGIVLTEANLQQFALSEGIEGNVKKMSARDKAILRYMYILKATKDMEGDFIRTQDSWANQTRLLRQVWQEFLITLGSGLISVLTPLVKALSAIVQQLTLFIQKLWIIISNIFGFELQDLSKQASGITDGLGEMNEEVEDLGDNATKAGKKIHKQLANFDELNNIVTQTNSGSSTSGGGGLSVPDVDLGLTDLAENGVDDFMDNLPKTLRELGKYIGDSIANMLDSIDWDSIYEKARNFGTGFADFLNGLFVDTTLFESVGRTIASALNTAIYAALAFGETFEWGEFGKKLADGVNTFFDTFDFAALGKTISTWVEGLWDLVISFVEEVEWSDIFKAGYEFFSNLSGETVFTLLGIAFFKSALVKAISKAIAEGMESVWEESCVRQAFVTFGTNLGGLLATAIPIVAIVASFYAAIKLFVDQFQNGSDTIKTIMMDLAFLIATVIAGIIAGPIAAIVIAVIGVIANIVLIIKDNWDAIVAWAQEAWNKIKDWFERAYTVVGLTIMEIVDKWNAFKQNISDIVHLMITYVVQRLTNFVNNVITVFTIIKTTVQSYIDSIKANISDRIEAIKTLVTIAVNAIKSVWSNAWNSVKSTTINIFNGIWSAIKSVINSILSGVERMANGIVSGINRVIQSLNNLQIDIPDWIPEYGGRSVGFNIPYVNQISIPRLAKGAVIPPNKEFMAVLGDQKSGTNIEAPLDTIKQAFAEVMAQNNGGNSGDIVVQIDGKEVFRAVRKQSQIFTKSTGLPSFA